MKPRSRFQLFRISAFQHLLVANSLLAAVTTASAQTWTGGGADANWTTAANWTGGTPSTSGTGTSTVTFYNTGATQLTNSTGGRYNLNQIAFTSGATSPVTINVTRSNTSFTTGSAIRFNAGTNISVAAGAHKIVGTGVSSGTEYDVIFNGAANTTHTFSISSGASFEIQGRIHHGSSNNKSYVKTGAGTLILSGQNGGSNAWTIDSSKSFQIQQGAVRFARDNATGSSANNYVVSSDAAFEIDKAFDNANVTLTLTNGNITLNGTGISSGGALRNISGNNTISANVSTGPVIPTGEIILNSNSSIGVDADTLTIRKVISGSGSLTKVGAGALVLGSTYGGSPTGVTFNNAYTGVTTISAGTLEVQGSIATSSSITNNAALVFNSGSAQSYANAINGNGTLTKSGAGTLTLSGGGSLSGNVIVSSGTLRLGANNGISTSAGLQIFGGASATRVLDLNGYNQTLSRFVFTEANSDGNLTINGTGTSKLTINATSDTELGPGGALATSTKEVVVNMSGLNEFEWNGATNIFRVGMRNGASNTNPATGNATVTLATTNTITASTLAIGTTAASNNGGTSILRLGQANALNASTISIGNGGRNNATLEFNTGLTNPTATIRGTAGGASRVTTWELGRAQSFGNSTWTTTAVFSAGTLDALVTDLRIGRADTGTAANRAGTVNATFSMGKGTLDVTNLTIGQYTGSGTGSVTASSTLAGNGIINLNDATGTVIAENIILADNIGTATLNTGSQVNLSGTFNLLAGTVEAKIIGKGADTGNATSVARNLNFTSGTIRNLAGNDLTISHVPINLTGSGTRNFEATTGQSITVAATAEITGSGQGFTKTGDGSLVLAGTNSYSGATLVSAGTLLVNGALASTAVTVDPMAVLGGTGTIAGSLTIAADSFIQVVDIDTPLAVGGTVTFIGSGFGIANLLGIDWDSLTLNTPYTVLDRNQDFSLAGLDNFGLEYATAVGNTGRQAYFTNGSLAVVIIPEPRAALLGGLGLLMLLRRRRG